MQAGGFSILPPTVSQRRNFRRSDDGPTRATLGAFTIGRNCRCSLRSVRAVSRKSVFRRARAQRAAAGTRSIIQVDMGACAFHLFATQGKCPPGPDNVS